MSLLEHGGLTGLTACTNFSCEELKDAATKFTLWNILPGLNSVNVSSHSKQTVQVDIAHLDRFIIQVGCPLNTLRTLIGVQLWEWLWAASTTNHCVKVWHCSSSCLSALFYIMCGMDHGIRLAINILGGVKTARVAARVKVFMAGGQSSASTANHCTYEWMYLTWRKFLKAEVKPGHQNLSLHLPFSLVHVGHIEAVEQYCQPVQSHAIFQFVYQGLSCQKKQFP